MKYIKLTQGYKAIVDDDLFDYLNQWKWCYARGYAMRRVYTGTGRKNNSGYNVYMHSLVLHPDKGMFADHISGDGLDNRRSNLRLCNKIQNAQNRRITKVNTSGYKGVTKKNNKWCARITVNRKLIHLGYFNDKKEAAKAYNKAAQQYFSEYARLN